VPRNFTRTQQRTSIGPIGVVRRARSAGFAPSTIGQDTAAALGPAEDFAFASGGEKRKREAVAAASKVSFTRDPVTGALAMPSELPSSQTFYGAKLREQLEARYATELETDVYTSITNIANSEELRNDPKRFRALAEDRIRALAAVIDPSAVEATVAYGQKLTSQYYGSLTQKKSELDFQDFKKGLAIRNEKHKSDLTDLARRGVSASDPEAKEALAAYTKSIRSGIKGGAYGKEAGKALIDQAAIGYSAARVQGAFIGATPVKRAQMMVDIAANKFPNLEKFTSAQRTALVSGLKAVEPVLTNLEQEKKKLTVNAVKTILFDRIAAQHPDALKIFSGLDVTDVDGTTLASMLSQAVSVSESGKRTANADAVAEGQMNILMDLAQGLGINYASLMKGQEDPDLSPQGQVSLMQSALSSIVRVRAHDKQMEEDASLAALTGERIDMMSSMLEMLGADEKVLAGLNDRRKGMSNGHAMQLYSSYLSTLASMKAEGRRLDNVVEQDLRKRQLEQAGKIMVELVLPIARQSDNPEVEEILATLQDGDEIPVDQQMRIVSLIAGDHRRKVSEDRMAAAAEKRSIRDKVDEAVNETRLMAMIAQGEQINPLFGQGLQEVFDDTVNRAGHPLDGTSMLRIASQQLEEAKAQAVAMQKQMKLEGPILYRLAGKQTMVGSKKDGETIEAIALRRNGSPVEWQRDTEKLVKWTRGGWVPARATLFMSSALMGEGEDRGVNINASLKMYRALKNANLTIIADASLNNKVLAAYQYLDKRQGDDEHVDATVLRGVDAIMRGKRTPAQDNRLALGADHTTQQTVIDTLMIDAVGDLVNGAAATGGYRFNIPLESTQKDGQGSIVSYSSLSPAFRRAVEREFLDNRDLYAQTDVDPEDTNENAMLAAVSRVLSKHDWGVSRLMRPAPGMSQTGTAAIMQNPIEKEYGATDERGAEWLYETLREKVRAGMEVSGYRGVDLDTIKLGENVRFEYARRNGETGKGIYNVWGRADDGISWTRIQTDKGGYVEIDLSAEHAARQDILSEADADLAVWQKWQETEEAIAADQADKKKAAQIKKTGATTGMTGIKR